MAFTGYCTVAEVTDKTVDRAITNAGWENSDVQSRIDEGYAYIESKIIVMGFTRAQLETAPLIKQINIIYSRYAILRDIYAVVIPTQYGKQEFVNWLKWVDDTLDKIFKSEIKLTDTNGDLIIPENDDLRYKVSTTTEDVKRIFTISEDTEGFRIDTTYQDEEVVGEK